ncbi:hypothetical protein [Paenibacillus sp.]|uniref:hypothetical protein n=1 Tax=Paenibacillus sp. TaxID=58172 RepID=UPI002D31D440|nr:hypothetical protein [Paenibacillus sp.]HZG84181.1 hypothetical protein [Paenibacillus sp.]
MARRLRARQLMARGVPIQGVVIVLLAIVCFFLVSKMFGSHDSEAAKDVVDTFYSLEKESNFAEAWELFHPNMKAKFEKNHYIQDRNHVFMQHFGVTTFEYELGAAKKMEGWTMSMQPDAPPIDVVYRVPVVQHYKSKFGTFDLVQDVFVAKHEGEWLILWSYK